MFMGSFSYIRDFYVYEKENLFARGEVVDSEKTWELQ